MVKTIRILGHNYKVLKKTYRNDGICHYGQADLQRDTIHVNKVNCASQNGETILHEIFHILSCRTASNLTERQVTAMSAGLYAVLKDNKKLP